MIEDANARIESCEGWGTDELLGMFVTAETYNKLSADAIRALAMSGVTIRIEESEE